MQNDSVQPADSEIGVALCSGDTVSLFEEFAVATFALVVDLASVAPLGPWLFVVTGRNRDELLKNWLRRMVSPQDGRSFLFCRFRVAPLGETRLCALVWGEPFNPERHLLYRSHTAVYPRAASVRRDSEGWIARVVFDSRSAPSSTAAAPARAYDTH